MNNMTLLTPMAMIALFLTACSGDRSGQSTNTNTCRVKIRVITNTLIPISDAHVSLGPDNISGGYDPVDADGCYTIELPVSGDVEYLLNVRMTRNFAN
jgi:hypothetical protein